MDISTGLSSRACLECDLVVAQGAKYQFLSKMEWPPSSPDFNPLDYSVWGNVRKRACAKPHKSLASLLNALTREWNNMPQEDQRAAVLKFRTRISSIVKISEVILNNIM